MPFLSQAADTISLFRDLACKYQGRESDPLSCGPKDNTYARNLLASRCAFEVCLEAQRLSVLYRPCAEPYNLLAGPHRKALSRGFHCTLNCPYTTILYTPCILCLFVFLYKSEDHSEYQSLEEVRAVAYYLLHVFLRNDLECLTF